jgi:hypothetical protein
MPLKLWPWLGLGSPLPIIVGLKGQIQPRNYLALANCCFFKQKLQTLA